MFLVGKLIGVWLTTDTDAELGLKTYVWDRTGQMAKQSIPRANLHRGFI